MLSSVDLAVEAMQGGGRDFVEVCEDLRGDLCALTPRQRQGLPKQLRV